MKIQYKLFSIFALFTICLVLTLVFAMQWSINKGMVEYVNQKEIEALVPVKRALEEHYQEKNSWRSLEEFPRRFERIVRQSLQGNEVVKLPPPRPPHRDRLDRRDRFNERPKPPHAMKRKDTPSPQNYSKKTPPKKGPLVSFALLDINKLPLAGDYPQHKNFNYLELADGNAIVGYLAVSQRKHLIAGYELDFLEEQKQHLWLYAAILLVLTLAISLPLATHFLKPIRALAAGMSKLTKGDFNQRLAFKRKDEFAQLSSDFNELAQTLDTTEASRKRWLANVSHELRTPVAIIKGELEAMIDGIRPLSKSQIESCHQEVNHLQRLIEDLHTLTSADIGGMSFRKETGDIVEFLRHESQRVQCYLANEGWGLKLHLPEHPVELAFDGTRVCQLIENIISNSLKYAQGGTTMMLDVSYVKDEYRIEMVIEDDGCGVEESQLTLLFEHLYRGDGARQGRLDGSGLGLAICAHIVAGHGGKIEAKKARLGGLAIFISLPI